VPLLPPEEQATLPEATLQHLRVFSCSKCAARSSKTSSQPGDLRAARAQPLTCSALSRRALQRRARGARARARRGPAHARPLARAAPRAGGGACARARLEVLERVLGMVQLGRQVRVGCVGRVAAQEGAVRLQMRAHLLQLLRAAAAALALGLGRYALGGVLPQCARVGAHERSRAPPGARPASPVPAHGLATLCCPCLGSTLHTCPASPAPAHTGDSLRDRQAPASSADGAHARLLTTPMRLPAAACRAPGLRASGRRRARAFRK